MVKTRNIGPYKWAVYLETVPNDPSHEIVLGYCCESYYTVKHNRVVVYRTKKYRAFQFIYAGKLIERIPKEKLLDKYDCKDAAIARIVFEYHSNLG